MAIDYKGKLYVCTTLELVKPIILRVIANYIFSFSL